MTPEELRALMDRLGMTQAECGWLLGLSTRQIRSWLNGSCRIPQAPALVLRAFDEGLISIDWFLSKISIPLL